MKNVENSCGCNLPRDYGCDLKRGCSCAEGNGGGDNCRYCVDEKSIFFQNIESEVENFDLKDVWTQFAINGTVMVPEVKPSIEQIDSVNSKVQIISRRVINVPAVYTDGIVTSPVTNEEGKITTGKKLIVEGLICSTISYVSLNEDQSVHSFHGQIPFSAFIVLPEDANLNANYEVYSLVANTCVKEVCDRSVNFTFCIILTAEKTGNTNCSKLFYADSGLECNSKIDQCEEAQCFTDQPVIKGVCSKVQIQNLIQDDTETLWTEISVPELLTIPDVKPDVKQILTVTSSVQVMCQKVINTPNAVPNYEGLQLTGLKLLVNAVLRQRITYISTVDCQAVHSAHFDVPVSAYIVLPEGTPSLSKYKIRTCIEDIYACALNNRQIFKNTTLFIKAEPIVCLK